MASRITKATPKILLLYQNKWNKRNKRIVEYNLRVTSLVSDYSVVVCASSAFPFVGFPPTVAVDYILCGCWLYLKNTIEHRLIRVDHMNNKRLRQTKQVAVEIGMRTHTLYKKCIPFLLGSGWVLPAPADILPEHGLIYSFEISQYSPNEKQNSTFCFRPNDSSTVAMILDRFWMNHFAVMRLQAVCCHSRRSSAEANFSRDREQLFVRRLDACVDVGTNSTRYMCICIYIYCAWHATHTARFDETDGLPFRQTGIRARNPIRNNSFWPDDIDMLFLCLYWCCLPATLRVHLGVSLTNRICGLWWPYLPHRFETDSHRHNVFFAFRYFVLYFITFIIRLLFYS